MGPEYNTKYTFVVTQDDGAFWLDGKGAGRRRRKACQFPTIGLHSTVPGLDEATLMFGLGESRGRARSQPWGRLTAVNTTTGDFAWQTTLGITEGLPEGKQNTGRPALAGAIVTAGGVLFVGSTDDNRFRAIDARTGSSCGPQSSTGAPTWAPSHTKQRMANSMWQLWRRTSWSRSLYSRS